MGSPRYIPRDFCSEPSDFGRSTEVKFAAKYRRPAAPLDAETDSRSEDDDVVFARASQVQHENVLAIRSIMQKEGMTIAQYADKVSESPRKVGAMLRGETVMRQDDLERADLKLHHVHMLIRAQHQRRIHANLVADLSEYKNDDVW